ncbi:MAG: phosphatidate cytidylyltransferase [Zoogloeaceae bacterium]|jgi:phosphatidate cytidylyltransferase|nr:phosphatidate cytidylyltransferase [Zoogloeaceae bacterium]
MLKQRIITALILGVCLLGALFFLPPIVFKSLFALIAGIAAWEWGRLAGLKEKGQLVFGVLICLCCFFLALVSSDEFWQVVRPGVGNGAFGAMPQSVAITFTQATVGFCVLTFLFWCIFAPVWLWQRGQFSQPVSLCIGFMLILATWFAVAFFQQPLLLLLVMGIAWVSDIAAYFTGRHFGGPKLAAAISPGKTRSGAYGALVGVGLYALIWNLVTWWPTAATASASEIALSMVLSLIGMLLLCVLGILGDLFESLLKRQAGIKDSSNILPGHGGVLDRIDSLLAILPSAVALNWLSAYLRYVFVS